MDDDESGQVTERLSRAVGQLAHEEEGIQLGGIYALERIYRDSVEDRAAVTEVLAAAVRARSNVENTPDSVPTIAAEAVAVLARREIADETPSARLQGAYLRGATLPQSNLLGAHLFRLCNFLNSPISGKPGSALRPIQSMGSRVQCVSRGNSMGRTLAFRSVRTAMSQVGLRQRGTSCKRTH